MSEILQSIGFLKKTFHQKQNEKINGRFYASDCVLRSYFKDIWLYIFVKNIKNKNIVLE